MKTYQKVLTAFAAAGLVTAAAFPYVKAYVDNLPKHLTVAEAGKVYLKAICPINKYAAYNSSLDKKYDHEMSVTYYIGSDAMDRANQRVAELGLRRKLGTEGYAKAEIQASKVLSDPKVIWPDIVKTEIKEYSTVLFTEGGLILDQQFDAADKVDNKNLSSKIRHNLNLPPVDQGCN